MISFPRIFRPCVSVSFAGYPIPNLDGTGHRIAFRVSKALTAAPDTAEVRVFGLSYATRSAMAGVFAEIGFAPMTIESGYDLVLGSLFVGDIRRLDAPPYAHADVPIVATGDDSGDAIANAPLPPAIPSTLGFNAQNMIDAAILAFAQPVINPATGLVSSPGTTIVPHPSVAAAVATANPAAVTTVYTFVNVGKARDLLDEAARLLGCRWWIRDKQLFMARRGLPVDGLAVELPSTHWLSEPAEEGEGVVRIATFLDPNLLPGRQVAIYRAPAKALTKLGAPPPGAPEFFRIEAGEYTGDTHGDQPWVADLTMRRILG